MLSIDCYAYSSKIRKINPMHKLLFSMMLIAICLIANNALVSSLTLFTISLFMMVSGKKHFVFFLKLMILPISFLIFGLMTIVVQITNSPLDLIISTKIFEFWVGITENGLMIAINIFEKSLACVASLYYLSLNTPMVDLLYALRKIKIPSVVVEIMLLIYRFIFILIDTAYTVFTAQNSRLGYIDVRRSYKSMGLLFSSLFVRAYKRADNLYIALEARGLDGEIRVLNDGFESSKALNAVYSIVVFALIIITYAF